MFASARSRSSGGSYIEEINIKYFVRPIYLGSKYSENLDLYNKTSENVNFLVGKKTNIYHLT